MKPCEPMKHKWVHKWGGTIRKCKKCEETHYYHFCEEQWELGPNESHSEKYGGPMPHDQYLKRVDAAVRLNNEVGGGSWVVLDQRLRPGLPYRDDSGKWIYGELTE